MRPSSSKQWANLRRKARSQILADVIWISVLVAVIFLISIGTVITKIALIALTSIFVLRFAPRIPGLRWFWVGLFGDRSFWDWMTLLCAPILLSSIGLLISTSINNQQNDMAVTRERLALSNDYYNRISEIILIPEFREHAKQIAERALDQEPYDNNSENCDPHRGNPYASMAYSRTGAVLRTLRNLKTSNEKYTSMQQSILQLLYFSGLINRRGYIVSLQQADLSETRISNIDLSKSCLDSVNFQGSYMASVKLDGSNLIRSSFRGANLTGAKLRSVNLSRRSDLSRVNAAGAKFNESDLREAVLFKSNLQKTSFDGAYLCDADLTFADLRGASLVGADLRGAKLNNADLRGVNLRDAKIDAKTQFTHSKYNKQMLNNKNSALFYQGLYNFLKSIQLDKAFDISGLARDTFELQPTLFDDNFQPTLKGMQLDHSL